jgi:RNA polymerase sigma-32 factor
MATSSPDAIELYSRDLARVPTMPPAEQHALAVRYAATHDAALARRLVTGNLRLVVKIARELGARRENYLDLVQEGNAGLMRAVERFDPARGVKLSTYAAWWIRAFILRHLMEQCHAVRAGSTREGRRRFFDGTLAADVSLDEPLTSAEGGITRLDTLVAPDELRPDVQVERHQTATTVARLVGSFAATLDRRGRTIVKRRLLQDQPSTLGDIAQRFSISRERARQVEKQLVTALRDQLTVALAA